MPTPLARIETPDAPAAIGPYSQAVRAGDLLFCSGQVALDPATGALVGDADVAAQARRALQNLGAVLHAAGADAARVVRTTIFLADMADFAKVNEVYGAFFAGAVKPARATVAVRALPKGALVEIDAIAYLG
ncbi:MAG TPA: RidA family protein [Myxococcota bacterium]|jgi:reactive intermediate/imine deaminase|nr:RidA family protein [Myxococcota bacterium]